MEQEATLFINEKDKSMGLVLENVIPASMKDAEYNVKTAFTKNELIACKCDCHAGGHNDERVVCVHILPLIYQLTMLLDDGLAEHLLIELCSRWDPELERNVTSSGKYDEVKNNIQVLMRHIGESNEKINRSMSKLTINEVLSSAYATGTERNKNRIPVPPDVKRLQALKDLCLESVVKKAKRRKAAIVENRENKENENQTNIYCQPCNDNEQSQSQNDNNDDIPDIFIPDYLDVYTSIKALDFDFESTEFPGFQLLHLRAKEDIEKIGEKKINQLIRSKMRRWKEDIKKCNKRKRPPPTSKSIRTSAKLNRPPTNAPTNTSTNTPTNPPTPTASSASPSRIPTPHASPSRIPTQPASPSRLSTQPASPSRLSTPTRLPSRLPALNRAPSRLPIPSRSPTELPTPTRLPSQLSSPSRLPTHSPTKTKNPISTTNIPTRSPLHSVSTNQNQQTICKPVKKKKYKGGPKRYCCFLDCNRHERIDPYMKRVISIPGRGRPNPETDRKRDIETFWKKKLERSYILKKCKQKDEGKVYYVCSHHKLEEVTEKKTIRYGKNLNKELKVSTTFQAPKGLGRLSFENDSANKSKGSANERMYSRNINNTTSSITHQAARENASLLMSSYDIIDELMKENERLKKENEEFRNKEDDIKNGNLDADIAMKSSNVLVSYQQMIDDDEEVKRRTGFQSLKHLLAFIILICNGDHNKMIRKTLKLTWLEEWFFIFEYMWGRTIIRWWDSEKP